MKLYKKHTHTRVQPRIYTQYQPDNHFARALSDPIQNGKSYKTWFLEAWKFSNAIFCRGCLDLLSKSCERSRFSRIMHLASLRRLLSSSTTKLSPSWCPCYYLLLISGFTDQYHGSVSVIWISSQSHHYSTIANYYIIQYYYIQKPTPFITTHPNIRLKFLLPRHFVKWRRKCLTVNSIQ